MSASLTLVMRPTLTALGHEWPNSGWQRLIELQATDGGRLPFGQSLTAGLRLRYTEAGPRLAPVIARGGKPTLEVRRQIRRELRRGSGTLWLSDPTMRRVDGFALRDKDDTSDGIGRWRRCLPAVVASKDVGALLPQLDAADPFWQQLDYLNRGTFFRFDSRADSARFLVVGVDDVEDEDSNDIVEADADVAGTALAGWWNPIVLQFSLDDLSVGPVKAVVAELLSDPDALLDVQVALADQLAGPADGAMAARFWLHQALRRRACEARIIGAPLPRLIFGPDPKQPWQALAFLLLDLYVGSFLLDVATRRKLRASIWLAPARTSSVGTISHWLEKTCLAMLNVEAAKPCGAIQPIDPVTLGRQSGRGVQERSKSSLHRDVIPELAALAEPLGIPPLLALARALDYRRGPQSPGYAVATAAAAALREAIELGESQGGKDEALLESVASALAVPQSAILLRFPDPPDGLALDDRDEWVAQAKRYFISIAESTRSPGLWWLVGLGQAPAASSAEPPWNLCELHWAARLYRAAFVQADASWQPSWHIAAQHGQLGEALLGEMILGGEGSPRKPMFPGRTRIANVNWCEDQGGPQ